jgi:hypothetical protein
MNGSIKLFALMSVVVLNVQAAPFLISDPLHPATAFCGMKIDTGMKINDPVLITGTEKTCHYDLSGITVGTHSVTVTAVPAIGDTVDRESDPSPVFTFTRPGIPIAPIGLALVTLSGKVNVQSQAVTGTICSWTVDGVVKGDIPVITSKCTYDVSSLPPGSHTLLTKAVIVDSIWGRLESAASTPFVYNVLNPLTVPSGLGLQP